MGLFDIFKSKKKSDGVIEEYGRTSQNYSNSYETNSEDTSDAYHNSSYHDPSHSFELTVEDVFTITGRGTVAVGKVSLGVIHTGDEVFIQTTTGETISSVIIGIEMFRKLLSVAQEGDTVGLLLKGITRNQIERENLIYKL